MKDHLCGHVDNITVQRVSASFGVLLDQRGDTLIVSVHPFLQVSFFLALVIVFAVGVWAGKPSADDEEGETEQEGEP